MRIRPQAENVASKVVVCGPWRWGCGREGVGESEGSTAGAGEDGGCQMPKSGDTDRPPTSRHHQSRDFTPPPVGATRFSFFFFSVSQFLSVHSLLVCGGGGIPPKQILKESFAFSQMMDMFLTVLSSRGTEGACLPRDTRRSHGSEGLEGAGTGGAGPALERCRG